MKIRQNYDDLWLKASVMGGLWASMEIIIGSFLHNTRLPFAGSILAFAGTVLLIGFYQLWPHKGLIIRAGFITAIMKSVSPSAIILGPMTGIILEAALIEIVLLLLGNNVLSVSLAGIFSLSSALFHKIASVLILYGFDIIKVYMNIINFALKQFGIAKAKPSEILLALLAFYFVTGALAGLMGLLLGKKALKLKSDIPVEIFKKGIIEKEFFEINDKNKTNIVLLWIHIFSVPTGLFLFNYYGFLIGGIFTFFYIAIFGYYYRKSMRRLKKPVFWSQLIIIVLLTTLFWNTKEMENYKISLEGFKTGIEMMVRAMFVITAFTAFSVELRNDKVRTFLFNTGFGKFYDAMRLAFGALPQMIALLPTAKEIIHKPVKSMLKPMIYADSWLEMFKKH
jgi:xanthosine utilization system XapX-like protein